MIIAFLIGCKKYDDADIADLKYADNDADYFAKTIASSCGFTDDEIILLSNSHENRNLWPTKSNIIRELSQSSKLSKRSSEIKLLFFFFSGHGFHSIYDGKDYLVPQDAVSTALEDTSIPFDTLIKYLRSWDTRNVILFLDACRAAVQGGKDVIIENWNLINVESLYSSGMASFCSCSPQQKSYESEKLSNGIFTVGLCEAFSDIGKCKTVYELDAYLVKRIPSICTDCGKPIQNPYTKVEPLSIQDVIIVSEQKLNEWQSLIPIGQEIRAPVPITEIINEGRYCAIDFGTSFSTIAVLDEHANLKYIPSSKKKVLVPSVVSFLSNLDYLVGWEALENAKLKPESTIFNVKRYFGSKKLFNIEGRTLSPEFIASLIIRSLKRNAEEFLCTKIGKILVSVPANFNIIQQNALAKACELAGLEVFRLIGEPCAASLLLQDTIYSDPKQDKLVLVIDLGGGTFDVSVMSIGEGVYETVAITGDNSLGGIDYDNAIYKYIVSKVQSLIENPNYVLNEVDKSQIRFEAERVKIALNSRYETSVILQNLEVDEHGLKNFEISINRELFRKLTKHLNSKVETCILQALNINSFYIDRLGGINLVLLAGQGSKIFTVNEIIEKLFPEVPIVRNFQESAVVHGLCKYTGLLCGLRGEDALLLDAHYTGIKIGCMPKPKGEEIREDFVISGDEAENTSTFALLRPSTTIPIFHNYGAAIKDIKSNKITLKIIEKSTIEEVPDSVIGNIEVEVESILNFLEIAIDCDTNRTIVLWIKNPEKKEISGFQINNFFLEATTHRPAHEYKWGMQTEGYKIQPIKKLNAS